MRWMAILLLLLVLPRVTLAVQGGKLVCFGGGHVEVDCHDLSDPACGKSEPQTPHDSRDSHDPCIDVSAAPVSLASRVAIESGPLPVGWLDLLPPVLVQIQTADGRPVVDLADESPPRFGARAFATFISPRT